MRPTLQIYFKLEINRRKQGSNWTTKQAERLPAAVIPYADGMFRWVELELDLFLPRSSYMARRQMDDDIDARLSTIENAQFKPLARLYYAYQAIWRNALGNDDEVARRTVLGSNSWRAFHNSPVACKSATEKVTEVADKVGSHLLSHLVWTYRLTLTRVRLTNQ